MTWELLAAFDGRHLLAAVVVIVVGYIGHGILRTLERGRS